MPRISDKLYTRRVIGSASKPSENIVREPVDVDALLRDWEESGRTKTSAYYRLLQISLDRKP